MRELRPKVLFVLVHFHPYRTFIFLLLALSLSLSLFRLRKFLFIHLFLFTIPSLVRPSPYSYTAFHTLDAFPHSEISRSRAETLRILFFPRTKKYPGWTGGKIFGIGTGQTFAHSIGKEETLFALFQRPIYIFHLHRGAVARPFRRILSVLFLSAATVCVVPPKRFDSAIRRMRKPERKRERESKRDCSYHLRAPSPGGVSETPPRQISQIRSGNSPEIHRRRPRPRRDDTTRRVTALASLYRFTISAIHQTLDAALLPHETHEIRGKESALKRKVYGRNILAAVLAIPNNFGKSGPL